MNSSIELDAWQKEVLETEGNICLRSGRQVGKSTVISIKAGEYAIRNPKKTIFIIAAVEREAFLIFQKVFDYIYDNYKSQILKGKNRPTKSKMKLKNGSIIHCVPAGLDGRGIRGYTINMLIADEAAFIPEDVWAAVTPMLLTTGGDTILLSTPHGKEGYFYKRFVDDSFTSFHINSEDIIANRPISKTWTKIQREKGLEYLAEQKKSMTKVQYAQEYLGEFIDELRQFFPTELIKRAMTVPHKSGLSLAIGDKFLGVDVARMGTDQSVLASVVRINREKISQFDMEITTKSLLTHTTRRILNADKRYNYKKIYIDDGGMGVGVFDPLLENEQTRRKVVAINNAARPLDNEESPKRKKILKEDLYNNLLYLLEKGRVELFDDPEVMLSLKSIQYEYTDGGRILIFGNYTHIAEALIRAAWCMKDKSLNIYIY